jgi:hypothetical protein
VDLGTKDSFDDYKTALAQIQALIFDNNLNNVIISGDFNANPMKKEIWNELRLFCSDLSVNFLDSKLPSDTYTYLSPSSNTVSWLDHVICSNHLADVVTGFEVLYDVTLDDHFPLAFSVNQDLAGNKDKESSLDDEFDAKEFIAWNKLKEEDINLYRKSLDSRLCAFDSFNYDSLCCYESKCRDPNHIKNIDQLYNEIIQMIKSASKDLNSVNKRKNYAIPGWNDHIKQLHGTARHAFLQWNESGRPTHGILIENMKLTRNNFRQALNWCKRNENKIRNDKLVEALNEKNRTNFWKCVKKINNNQQVNKNIRIDGINDKREIVEIFSNKFKDIFNNNECQSDDDNVNFEYTPIKKSVRYFETSLIKTAIIQLKITIGQDNIHAYHLKYAPQNLHKMLSNFFSTCYRHSHTPRKLISGVINPLIKNYNGDIEDSKNYRPIIASSVLLKILELLIKNKMDHLFNTNHRQFAYKKNASTLLAHLMLKEVTATYAERNSYSCAAFLDLSKAFDRVNHAKLFKILEKKQWDPGIIELMKSWYKNQYVSVKLQDASSKCWLLGNGVRQGGILSAYLFALYIDAVIDKIVHLNVGCKIDLLIVNIILYADDIVLLAPNLKSLQYMLNVLCEELNKLGLKINYTKTVCMLFSKKDKIKPNSLITMEGENIKFVNEYNYLGFIVNSDMTCNDDVILKRNKFYSSFNILLRKFHFLDINAFMVLFHAHCLQFYGSELWLEESFKKSNMKKFAIGFHKSLKKIVKLPYYVSNHFVCDLLGLFTFEHYLNWSKVRFCHQLLRHKNKLCKSLSNYFENKSFLLLTVNRMLNNAYDITSSLKINDLGAIKARIQYVQNHEPRSNCFEIL